MNWALRDAKNRFSEVVQRTKTEGPQEVTVRGKRAAVIVSAEEYDRLVSGTPSFVDHLLAGPPWDDELVDAINDRPKWPVRPDVKF